MDKRHDIADLEAGAPVDEVYFLQELTLGRTRSGNRYLTLGLSDRTGALQARVWQDAEALAWRLAPDSFVRVRGHAESYRGRLRLNLSGIEPLDAAALTALDQSRFVPESFRDRAELEGYIDYFLTEVYDSDYSRLLEAFFGDPDFRERFARAPGDVRSHHAYLGGLIEHTVSVATMCQHVCVQHPRLNSGLLITAALLHDIGKVAEYRWEGRIQVSREGKLLGHVLIGQRMVEEKMRELGGFDRERELELLHAIISHHGELEWGAPKRPQSAEALVLHHIDNLDAKVKGFLEVVEGRGEVSWPELQNLFRRPLDQPMAADRADND